MKRLLPSFALLLVLVLSACETEIKFDGPLTNPLLTVNCLACADSAIQVDLSASRFFLDSRNDFPKIDDATINLFVNGSFVEQLTSAGEGHYVGNYIAHEGDELRLNASATGYKDVWAETSIPFAVTNFQIDTTFAKQDSSYLIEGFFTGSGPNGYEVDTVGVNYYRFLTYKVRFDNIDAKREYFRLVIYRESVSGGQHFVNEYKNDVEDIVFSSKKGGLDGLMSETGYDPYQIFTDELIDGETHTLTFDYPKTVPAYYDHRQDLPQNKRSEENLVVDVQSISKEYYLYLQSLKARGVSDPVMSEPVQIYSNVQNGLGLLGGKTHQLQRIDLTK